jgi:hypothetical protein
MDVPVPANKRLLEIAKILAAGLMRLQARKSSPISPACEESSLDFLASESGHPPPENGGMSDG